MFYGLSRKCPRCVTQVHLGSLKFLALPPSKALLPVVKAELVPHLDLQLEKQGEEQEGCISTILKTWPDNGNHHFGSHSILAPFNFKRGRIYSP